MLHDAFVELVLGVQLRCQRYGGYRRLIEMLHYVLVRCSDLEDCFG